jgi:hypothetical protein
MTASSALRWLSARLIGLVRQREHYAPERHYMRGPGPKWIEKHGTPPAADEAARAADRAASRLSREFGSA